MQYRTQTDGWAAGSMPSLHINGWVRAAPNEKKADQQVGVGGLILGLWLL